MGRVVNASPRLLYPRERDPVTTVQEIGGGGEQGHFGRVLKISSPPPGFEPRTVQPVASRYTDWDIRAVNSNIMKIKYQSQA